MDLLKKCDLITGNHLFNNSGIGKELELDLQINKEIRDELIQKLESLIKPLFDSYKNYKKYLFYSKNRIDFKLENSLEDNCKLNMGLHSKISELKDALENINKIIEESEKELKKPKVY